MTTFALIIADPNCSELGEIVSTHRSLRTAGRAYQGLDNARWAYVAERQADGNYPLRTEAAAEATHRAALDAANAR